MPEAGKSKNSVSGVRADGSPRRPSYRDKPTVKRGQSAGSTGSDRRAEPGGRRSEAQPGAARRAESGTGRRASTSSRSDGRSWDRTDAPRGSGGRGTTGRNAASSRSAAPGRGDGGAGARGRGASDDRGTGRTEGVAGRATGGAGRSRAAQSAPGTKPGTRAGGAKAAGTKAGKGVGTKASKGTKAAKGTKTSNPGKARATLAGSGGTRSSNRPRPAVPERRALPTASPSVRKPSTRPATEPVESGELERLQKVLATAGVGSRRASEELIVAGRVRVDGRVATLGDKVDPINAEIHVDGERVITDSRRVYLAMNKPAGVVSTMSDERGREALADYLGDVPQRVYHVGRLDADSEGLLLLTNDGTLAHRLMHPSYGVLKTYLAEVPGPIRSGLRQQLLEGVELEDGPAKADAFRVIDSLGNRVLVEVVLHEGRKHIVRRMLEAVGHPVSRLVRTSIGPIKIGDLKAGRTRRLTAGEIAALFRAVED